LPWEKAKAFDGSAVIGEFYPKEKFNLDSISFQLHKNDKVVQDGNTDSMLWKIDELISYVSQYFTLKKGDVIFTGTPAGVGKVEENDVLTGIIEGKQAFQIKIK
jgi:2-keto-4-pentenoate hydratase/2-oxohepta-3-ene-1,7-dioic acid hydratase in catechol pathway